MYLRLCVVCVLLAKSFAFHENSTHTLLFGFYQNSNVIELFPSNFDELVLQSDQMWIVQFYATWCYYSMKIVPEYIQLAGDMKERQIRVGAMVAHGKDPFFDRLNLRGVPTIKIFGADKLMPIYYKGKRTAEDIEKFVDELLANGGEEISDYYEDYVDETIMNESIDGSTHLPLRSGIKKDNEFFAKFCFATIMACLYLRILT